ncbi:DUF6531 domain-containing protein [Rugamonas sp. CCM 8940]|uniref:DUF6531 domain-containing protein n=1 Tax=Rugamonas sp. CCM 8940 TaxID=2765359 RepID=UPI0018F656AA|nr:DUF6531 domain-containing protein [Rugamonas sp. CCM 8940]MBJ7311824.1 RHS repeat protein [Rugamonas sp. CCM 8940]
MRIRKAFGLCLTGLSGLSISFSAQADSSDNICFPLYRDAGAIPMTASCKFDAVGADFGLGTYFCGNSPPIDRYCGEVLKKNSCDADVGHPINSSNGNKHLTETDFNGTGLFPLTLERYYDSSPRAQQQGALGTLWRSSLDRKVRAPRSDKALVYRPDGTVVFFTGSVGNWLAGKGVTDVLKQLLDAAGQTTGWSFRDAASDTVETYDAGGHLTSITARNGQRQTFTLSTNLTPSTVAPKAGLPIAVSDHFGKKMTLTWDNASRLATLTDPGNHTYSYGYDAEGRLTSVTAPSETTPLSSKRYLYNELALTANVSIPSALTGIIDENDKRLATYHYDAEGRAVATEYASGVDKYQLSYGVGATTIVDPLQTSRVYTFKKVLGAPRLTGISQPGGAGCSAASNTISYDGNGNVASRTDFTGTQTIYTYDLVRNLEISRIEAATLPEARTITTEWHPSLRLRTKIAEPKLLTTQSYDAAGNLITRTLQATSDATGAQGLKPTFNGVARSWTYTYNTAGQLRTATGPRSDVLERTTYTYDDATGQLATITNAAGQVTRVNLYDDVGRPTVVTEPNGVVTKLDYYPRGWLKSSSTLAPGAGTGDTTGYAYDDAGLLKTVSLPDGNTISYRYDDAQRLTGVTDKLGNTINYILDNKGNRTEDTVKDPGGVLSRQTTRVYDALNRMRQQTGGMQ